MKAIARGIGLPILVASLVLAPLPVFADQPAYPENFRALGIAQMPGSKVIEVRLEGGAPVAVTLDSEETHRGVDVVFFYGNASGLPEEDWYYDHDRSESLAHEPKAMNMLFENNHDGTLLLIKISPKGRSGSRIELLYPWVDPTADWFLELLEHGADAEQ